MSGKSAIEWTDATWNPVSGCSKVSPGCAHCYAERISLRFGHTKKPWKPENAEDNVTLHPERLGIPLRWRTPRRVFVNSMSDLFHELVPDAFIDQVFAVMAAAPQHTFQVLTKRPARMLQYFGGGGSGADLALSYRVWKLTQMPRSMPWPLPNVWLGVSAENQHWADERIPILLDTPAAVRFVSAEPLLGYIDFERWLHDSNCSRDDMPCICAEPREAHLDWIIVGGESGPGARPMEPTWVRGIRAQCNAVDDVSFFFKQWGGRTPKAGGRELDGRTWDEMPA